MPAPRAAITTSARAAASRRNGARSRGPTTPEGKARSAQNALKHGLRAQKYVVLQDEDAAEFAALEAALTDELAPQGALQSVLVGRGAVAAWRLARADRIETELFAYRRVRMATSLSRWSATATAPGPLKPCCGIAVRRWRNSAARCGRSRRSKPSRLRRCALPRASPRRC
ncbi:MAG: hypothetical protein ACREX3_09100 [Gammaproteobacteria bacterium]